MVIKKIELLHKIAIYCGWSKKVAPLESRNNRSLQRLEGLGSSWMSLGASWMSLGASWKASEPAGRSSEPAGRALDPVRKASEQARRAS